MLKIEDQTGQGLVQSKISHKASAENYIDTGYSVK